MRKRDELSREHACMQHAHPDEMVFVLLSRDAAAPIAIRAWVTARLALGKNTESDAQIVEALECARTMEAEGTKWKAAIEQIAREVHAEHLAGPCQAWAMGRRCAAGTEGHAGEHVFLFGAAAEADPNRCAQAGALAGDVFPEIRTIATPAQCDQMHSGVRCERPAFHKGEHLAESAGERTARWVTDGGAGT